MEPQISENYAMIGKWKILSTIGRGAVKVKLGVNTATGIEAAIKIYRFVLDNGSYKFPKRVSMGGELKDILVDREAIMEELRQEAGIIEVLQKKKSPHIIEIYEFHESITYRKRNGSKVEIAAIVMEIARGGELYDYLDKKDKLSQEFVRYYFSQILSSLDYCHRNMIAHRDIKPNNILFDTNYNIKLIDFGHATFLSTSDCTLSRKVGTAGYMAPEIIEGKPYSGTAVDLFAVGVVLFNMSLVGIPFRNATLSDPHFKCLSNGNDIKKYWNATDPKNELPTDLRDFIQKLLTLDPSKRATLDDLKAHEWLNKETPNLQAIQEEFERRLGKFQTKKRQEEEEIKIKKRCEQQGGDQKMYRTITKEDLDKLIQTVRIPFDATAKRELKSFSSIQKPGTQFMVAQDPDYLFKFVIVELANKHFDCSYSISSKDYKIKGTLLNEDEIIEMAIILTKVDETTQCVEFQRISGNNLIFHEVVQDLFKPSLESLETFLL